MSGPAEGTVFFFFVAGFSGSLASPVQIHFPPKQGLRELCFGVLDAPLTIIEFVCEREREIEREREL